MSLFIGKSVWASLFFKNGPIPTCFCLFSSFSRYNFNITNWKKHRWCALDLALVPQDGRCRRNHGAMATAPNTVLYYIPCSIRRSVLLQPKARQKLQYLSAPRYRYLPDKNLHLATFNKRALPTYLFTFFASIKKV